MYKPTCDNCGPLDSVLLDGALILDRALEDVWLVVTFNDGKPSAASCLPEDEGYMEQFNTAWIYGEALEIAAQADILVCPKCRDDIDGPDS